MEKEADVVDWNQSLNVANVGLIVGRQEEYETLWQAYQRIQMPDEQSRVILIHGESGSGKTALVQHFQTELFAAAAETAKNGNTKLSREPEPPLQEQQRDPAAISAPRGGNDDTITAPFFVNGKFDQNCSAARPYSAIVDAMTQLVQCIQDASNETDPSSLRETIRIKLYDTMDEEVSTLLAILPALEPILGGVEWKTKLDAHQKMQAHHHGHHHQHFHGSNQNVANSNSNHSRRNNNSSNSSNHQVNTTPPAHAATNPYALKRVMDLLRILLRFVCTPEHPVVLFLDDLQWADEASRQFISTVAGDVRSTNLLLLGAIREGGYGNSSGDNEDGEGDNNDNTNLHHRLPTYVLTTEDPRSQLFTTRLELGPLEPELVHDMICKLVELPPNEETEALSVVISRKTSGNAFYVIQYMEMLAREYLINFMDDEGEGEYYPADGASVRTGKWEWDLDAIQSRTEMSESLLEVISDKVVVLSNDVQDILMVASCLGFGFDADLLEAIVVSQGLLKAPGGDMAQNNGDMDDGGTSTPATNGDDRRFHKALGCAMKEGLILQASDDPNHYYFTHDRVHQATMELIPPPPKRSRDDPLPLKVGHLVLMMSRAIPHQHDMFFVGVDLVMQHSLVSLARTEREPTTGNDSATTTKRIELARLLLEASRKASIKVAYTMAADYADRALQLLPPGEVRWTDSTLYPLTLDLCNLSSEMNYAHGTPARLDLSEVSVLEILRHAKTLRDKFRAYDVHLGLFNARRDFTGALRESNALLKLVGTPLPPKVRMSGVLYAFVTTKRLLQRKKAQELLSLPTLMNDSSLHVMRILNFMTLFAWSSGQPETLVLAILKMIKITISEGVCEYSPFAFASYSSMLGGMGDYATAFEYGALALDLVERPGMRAGYARTVEVVHFAVYHLRHPIRESLHPVLRAYHIGMETGDVDFAAMCLCCHTCLSLHAGSSLHYLEDVLVGYVHFFLDYRQDAVRVMVLPWLQLTLNLMGKSNNPLVLTGNVMNEDDFEAQVRTSNYVAAAAHASYARLILYYVFGDLDLAEAERKLQVQYSEVDKLSFMKCFNVLFCGLTCLGLARKDKAKRKIHQRRARAYIKELEAYSKVGSANCVPMLALLEAEFATMLGTKGSFMDTYDAAIAMASRSGFRLMKGIACERAAEYAMSSGDLEMAGEYVESARKVFHDFGAEGKLIQMDQRYSRVTFPNSTANTTSAIDPSSLERNIRFSD
jgi:predicted ATPase